MIPLKSSDLLIKIMDENNFDTTVVAKKLGVSRRSIHRLLKGDKPSGKLVVSLIALYLQLNTPEDADIGK